MLFTTLGLGHGTAQQVRLDSLPARASGTVVRMVVGDSGDGTSTSPLIEFLTADEQRVRFEGSADPPPHHIGQKVVVAYDPADPPRAMIASFWDVWLTPLLAAGWGLLILLFMAFALDWRRGSTG
jgi:Protein of unknown function (DUF3592)